MSPHAPPKNNWNHSSSYSRSIPVIPTPTKVFSSIFHFWCTCKVCKVWCKSKLQTKHKIWAFAMPYPNAQVRPHLKRTYPHKASTLDIKLFRIFLLCQFAAFWPISTFALIIFNFGKYSALSHYLLKMFKWGTLRHLFKLIIGSHKQISTGSSTETSTRWWIF